ncbi:RPB5 subunit of DNA-directed RNA polymerase [Ramicandelaber brevisporus]|nr:RPB5 subunit of DNA-directed RNA polymerase [Ramicandelaber brevisporus]
MDDREIVKMFRVRRTLNKMLADRGYNVTEEDIEKPLAEFQAEHARNGTIDRGSLTVLVQHRDDPNDQLLAFFPEDASVGVRPIRKYCELMMQRNIRKGIIIYHGKMSSAANKAISGLAATYQLEAFLEDDLVVNITEHNLVPRHIVLGVEEKKALLNKYSLKETQLPRILQSDPVARYYGLRRGQVVKIIRTSETAGRYLTYRLCM